MPKTSQAKRDYARQYAADHKDERREYQRQWREKNKDQIKMRMQEWHAANPDYQMRRTHGLTLAEKQAVLDVQEGCCYLCGDAITLDDSVIDHDHRCCPQKRSCPLCRRGLACTPCNQLLGLADDDPARLERIAASLRIAVRLVEARLQP